MHFPPLIQDLAVILSVAAVVTFVFRLIRQPVVLGYVIAGVIVGPYTPDLFSVSDTGSIKIWAELGVIFLMFSLGLEFSFRRLAGVGMSAVITALIQVVVMIFLGMLTSQLLGWSALNGAFLGCMIAISSTTIIIKALEELQLTRKKFAELVFGILIVEDLAAILMLVGLTNIATSSSISGVELLIAAGKLAFVVAVWFLVGMFLVPKFVSSVRRVGNDEMLTVVATGLCLALVAVAAHFHYSVALGAFMMGSILAESSEVKRIEHLVAPLKDIFGAIFFVSVGMLLDPRSLVDDFWPIILISFVIVFGKLLSITIGAFLTGQTLRTSIQTGLSMAQIGEFSFIIAGLGLSYQVMEPKLYPIIIAASVFTTFTTPYLIKLSSPLTSIVEERLPLPVRRRLDLLTSWLQRLTLVQDQRRSWWPHFGKWSINAVVVVAIFTLQFSYLLPIINNFIEGRKWAILGTWFMSFLLSAPFLWAMANSFQTKSNEQASQSARRMLGGVMTLALLGVVSMEYFPATKTLFFTLILCLLFIVTFRRRIAVYHRWFERQFRAGFSEEQPSHSHLVPWDAHLVQIEVPVTSQMVGRTLADIRLRELFGISIVVISRQGKDIVAPNANTRIFPGDDLLCFATDDEIEKFSNEMCQKQMSHIDDEEYQMRKWSITLDSNLANRTIKQSGIREEYDCLIVGIERNGERIRNPLSDQKLLPGDLLWIVGEVRKLNQLIKT